MAPGVALLPGGQPAPPGSVLALANPDARRQLLRHAALHHRLRHRALLLVRLDLRADALALQVVGRGLLAQARRVLGGLLQALLRLLHLAHLIHLEVLARRQHQHVAVLGRGVPGPAQLEHGVHGAGRLNHRRGHLFVGQLHFPELLLPGLHRGVLAERADNGEAVEVGHRPQGRLQLRRRGGRQLGGSVARVAHLGVCSAGD
mmetsp:Transcript_45203/g.113151  ORF Transcript_45203/g.113151 Transcript_45203/m.113151 type:complete len:203 (+) Transcript_45203:148-756(+)